MSDEMREQVERLFEASKTVQVKSAKSDQTQPKPKTVQVKERDKRDLYPDPHALEDAKDAARVYTKMIARKVERRVIGHATKMVEEGLYEALDEGDIKLFVLGTYVKTAQEMAMKDLGIQAEDFAGHDLV